MSFTTMIIVIIIIIMIGRCKVFAGKTLNAKVHVVKLKSHDNRDMVLPKIKLTRDMKLQASRQPLKMMHEMHLITEQPRRRKHKTVIRVQETKKENSTNIYIKQCDWKHYRSAHSIYRKTEQWTKRERVWRHNRNNNNNWYVHYMHINDENSSTHQVRILLMIGICAAVEHYFMFHVSYDWHWWMQLYGKWLTGFQNSFIYGRVFVNCYFAC